MCEHVPMVGIGLAHSSGSHKFWENDYKQVMFIEETQSIGGSFWPQNSIQFVVHAFPGYLRKQLCVTRDQASSPGVKLKLVAHHQPDSPQHTQGIMTENLIIDCFQTTGLQVNQPIQGINEMQCAIVL